jgi:hypothetical protein
MLSFERSLLPDERNQSSLCRVAPNDLGPKINFRPAVRVVLHRHGSLEDDAAEAEEIP